jgi:hypothetical protein
VEEISRSVAHNDWWVNIAKLRPLIQGHHRFCKGLNHGRVFATKDRPPAQSLFSKMVIQVSHHENLTAPYAEIVYLGEPWDVCMVRVKLFVIDAVQK